MPICATCLEKEQLLKEAVVEHWRELQQYSNVLAASETAILEGAKLRAAQLKINDAENSYRLHVRVVHGMDGRCGRKAV